MESYDKPEPKSLFVCINLANKADSDFEDELGCQCQYMFRFIFIWYWISSVI